jgi:hypothetical protein
MRGKCARHFGRARLSTEGGWGPQRMVRLRRARADQGAARFNAAGRPRSIHMAQSGGEPHDSKHDCAEEATDRTLRCVVRPAVHMEWLIARPLLCRPARSGSSPPGREICPLTRRHETAEGHTGSCAQCNPKGVSLMSITPRCRHPMAPVFLLLN